MAFRPGVGFTSIPVTIATQTEGQPHGPGRDMPYSNPNLAQQATCTFTASADVSDEIVAGQIITTVLTDPDGTAFTATYTVTAADDTAGTDAAGLELMAQRTTESINAELSINGIATATYVLGVVTVVWDHPEPRGDWTFSVAITPDVAETTLVTTEAVSQTTGGTAIPMGRFLESLTPVTGDRRRGGLPTTTTGPVLAFALRDPTQPRGTSLLAGATNDYAVGTMMTGREKGQASAVNVDAVAAVYGDPVYTVIDITGGDALGQARVTRDGVVDLWTATPTAANTTVYGLTFNFPAWDGQAAVSYALGEVISDGSGTATEICDLFRTELGLAGNADLAALVVGSGTATLILTGVDLGRPFTVVDSAEAGDWASITNTTPAAQYTRLVTGARWDEPVAADAVGKIYLNS